MERETTSLPLTDVRMITKEGFLKKEKKMNTGDIESLVSKMLSNEKERKTNLYRECQKQSTSMDHIEKMNIINEKHFNSHLQLKLNKLSMRLQVLQIKYAGYKQWYDWMNIMIILVSSILSVFEASRNEVEPYLPEHGFITSTFDLTPIFISSFITCSAAIIKFKKYQEKMENMQFTREKVILAISKIKSIQEALWFSKEGDLESIKKKYLDDIYMFYNESNSELERHIKFSDHYKLKQNRKLN